MKKKILAALLVFGILSSSGALCCLIEENLDGERQITWKHPPPPGDPPWTYYLTCYGGPNDGSAYLHTPGCGGKVVDGAWWYSTGAYSFGCFSKLELSANGKCVVVNVVDNGPAGWTEEKAAQKCGGTGYIIDASPLAIKHLYGLNCAGWSDCKSIQVRPVDNTTPDGPCSGCEYQEGQNIRKCGGCGEQECQNDDGLLLADSGTTPLQNDTSGTQIDALRRVDSLEGGCTLAASKDLRASFPFGLILLLGYLFYRKKKIERISESS